MASRFRSLHDTEPTAATLSDILQEIKTTRPILLDRDKARLPLYSPHTMESATDDSVTEHSGVFIFDIDSLSEAPIANRERIKQWLSRDEFIAFCLPDNERRTFRS